MTVHRLTLRRIALVMLFLSAPAVARALTLSSEVEKPAQTFTFVGRYVCSSCHPDIEAEYARQPHGQNFRNHEGTDLIDASGGACAPCHTTGYDEPSGFPSSSLLDRLEGISCEECHGRGSRHANAPSRSNIHFPPVAEQTCWDCHVPRYKMLRGQVGEVTDKDLKDIAPEKINVRYSETLLMLGKYGYKRTGEPGPHRWTVNTCVDCHLNPASSDYGVWAPTQDPSASPTVPSQGAAELDHGRTALAPDLATCVRCHDSGEAVLGMLNRFRDKVNRRLIEIGGADPANPAEPDREARGGLLGAYAAENRIDLTGNGSPSDPAVKAYKGARHDFSLVLADKGRGIHNPEFAVQVLKDAKDLLTKKDR